MQLMTTDFERIPEEFVDRYMPEIQAWAGNFRTEGNRKGIVLRGPVRGVPARYEALGGVPSIVGVTLVAEREAHRMVVRPASEQDEDVIRRHVEAMRN